MNADWKDLRVKMVREQIESRGIEDSMVLSIMAKVPRHEFVPRNQRERAYEDSALPLGPGQTVSQPYIVALMLDALHLQGTEKLLEVGTGSGYQTATLAEAADTVYSIELDPDLSQRAGEILARLGYENVRLKAADGFAGWKEESPFDVIVVSAAPPEIPRELVHQLRDGGKMVIPFGEDDQQELVLLEKDDNGLQSTPLGAVRFVPMKKGD